jgi:chromosome partitioning protein
VPQLPAARSPEILAIANQKGGVGKTTTAINLGAALAEAGKHVLADRYRPAGKRVHRSWDFTPDRRTRTTYDVLIDGVPLESVIQQTPVERLWIAPASTDLTSADIELVGRDRRLTLLRSALSADMLYAMPVDYVLIDCPPSLNLLTLNALVAAQGILVPLQCEFFALGGLVAIDDDGARGPPFGQSGLRIAGVVLTMHDSRTRLTQQVELDARATLGDVVFQTVIPRNVRLSEAPSYAVSVLQHDSDSKGSAAYRALARELMQPDRGPAVAA